MHTYICICAKTLFYHPCLMRSQCLTDSTNLCRNWKEALLFLLILFLFNFVRNTLESIYLNWFYTKITLKFLFSQETKNKKLEKICQIQSNVVGVFEASLCLSHVFFILKNCEFISLRQFQGYWLFEISISWMNRRNRIIRQHLRK